MALERNPYITYTDLLKINHLGADARVRRSDCCQANGINDTAADQIRIAENQRVHPLIELALRARQDVFAVEIPGLIFTGSHVAHQHGMLLALLIVHAAHGQIFAGIADAAERYQSAGIIRFGKPLIIHEFEGDRRKQLGIDSILCKSVRPERTTKRNRLVALASGRSKVGEVTVKHLGRWHEGTVDGWRGPLDGRLFAAEEK